MKNDGFSPMLINRACGFTSISVVWFGYVQDTLIEENIIACSGTTYIDDRWKRSLRSAGGAIMLLIALLHDDPCTTRWWSRRRYSTVTGCRCSQRTCPVLLMIFVSTVGAFVHFSFDPSLTWKASCSRSICRYRVAKDWRHSLLKHAPNPALMIHCKL